MLSSIYAITDPALLPGETLYSAVTDALQAGVKSIQLRDKTATDKELSKTALRLREICEQYDGSLIINDRVDIALASNSHGVHLGQGDGDVSRARQLLGPKAIIGVTCHDRIELADKAVQDGASYIAFGRFFPSSTKPDALPAPLSLLKEAKSRFSLPVVAIGGITLDNMHLLINNGADSLALCHTLFATPQVAQCAQQLIRQFQHIQKDKKPL